VTSHCLHVGMWTEARTWMAAREPMTSVCARWNSRRIQGHVHLLLCVWVLRVCSHGVRPSCVCLFPWRCVCSLALVRLTVSLSASGFVSVSVCVRVCVCVCACA
jgi:hypothetical protein